MTDERMQTARKRFNDSLPGRIALMLDGVGACESAPDDGERIEKGALAAHSLAGAAAMFGRPDLGDMAREVELAFEAVNAAAVIDRPGRIVVLRQLADALAEAADDRPASPAGTHGPGSPDSAPRLPATDQLARRMLLIEDDTSLASAIAEQLTAFGWQVDSVNDATHAQLKLRENIYQVVTADIILPEGPLAGTQLVSSLPSRVGNPPVIFMSARWDWEARLAAVRAGAAAYLPKPVEITRLAEVLDKITSPQAVAAGRILLVDDDLALSEAYAALLERAGHSVMHLAHPAGMLDAIPEFAPELIIMDLHMSGCSGIDAARVLRQDNSLIGIPILFLSSDARRGPAQQAIIAGADDFLLKPIGGDWLVAAVNARILRARAMNSLSLHDSMTGLLNHLSVSQLVDRDANAASREGTPLSVAFMDIDLFKSINDTHGHPVGDKVIRSLAQLLKHRLRRSDAAGRYGGEEFLVVLRNTNLTAAQALMEDLRERFADIRFQGKENAQFSATLSAGVCEMRPGEDGRQLIQRADEALYVAKRAGRNRVIVDG